MSLPSRLLGANPSIQVSALLSGSLSTPSAKQTFIPPTSYESIATTTLSGSQATITFSSIPATFKHLQVRISAKNTRTGQDSASVFFEINGDTNNNNYTTHYMSTSGSTPTSFGRATGNYTGLSGISPSADVTSNLGPMIYDFIDYANTTKYKTIRSINGFDKNGGGSIYLSSNLWLNTNAISTIEFTVPGYSWATYSKFALYGIKG